MIPASIRSRLTQTENGPPSELRSFEKLYTEARLFQSDYLPKLRVSTSDFAKCVQAMNANATVAWQTLRDSSGGPLVTEQEISWAKLKGLSAFREVYEQDRGSVCRVITRQMEQIETHVIGAFATELVTTYRSETERIIKKYSRMDIGTKFPFRSNGPPADEEVLFGFFDDLNMLSKRYELDQGLFRVSPEGEKTPINPAARSIVHALLSDQWRHFYQDCMALEAFLYKDGSPRSHKLKASMVPGPAGAHFHWLRIAFGSGAAYDLNLYGKPVVEMNLMAENRSLTLHGLDAAKIPQASTMVAKGERAFLQMVYLFGTPLDADRKSWLVDVELPLSVDPSFSVRCTIKLEFNESLPVLPSWQRNVGYAGFRGDDD